MKDVPAAITTELAKDELAPISLYVLTLLSGVVIRYAQYDVDITFGGQTYEAFVVEKEVIRTSTESGIDNVRIAVANVDKNITLLLAQNDGLRGARVQIFTVFAGLLDDPDNRIITFDGKIVGAKVTQDIVLFEVLSVLDVQYLQIPGRVFRAERCQWVYKETDTCKYAGDLPTCSKLLEGDNGCRIHDNVKNYGGYPGIPQKRTVVF